MTLPTFVAATTAQRTTSGTPLTFTMPTVLTNDVAVAVVSSNRGSNVTLTPPAGWSTVSGWAAQTTGTVSSDVHQEIWVRVLAGTDSGTTQQWTASTGSSLHGVIAVFRGVNTTTPVDVTPAPATSTSSGTTAAALTTVTPETMVVYIGTYGTGTTAPTVTADPSGMTVAAQTASAVGSNDGRTYVAYAQQSLQGTTGTKTATTSGSATKTATGLLVLRPAVFTVPPVASAGANRNGVVGEAVQLDASASAAGQGGALSYTWASLSGPTPTFLTTSSVVRPIVRYAAAGTSVMQVTVSETGGTTATSTVTVTVTAGQIVRPTTDVTTTSWTKTPGGAASVAATLSDNDLTSFVTSVNNPSALVLRETLASLSDPGAPPRLFVVLAPFTATSWTIVIDVIQSGTTRVTRTYTSGTPAPIITDTPISLAIDFTLLEYQACTWPATFDVRITATVA